MKFRCGDPMEKRERRHDYLSNWHPWFAWYPVKVGKHDCRWLEWVERRGNYWAGGFGDSWWTFSYQAKTS